MSKKHGTSIDREKGSGDIFADLGLENADGLYVGSQLGFDGYRILTDMNLTQREAAAPLGIKQSEVSQLMNGHFSRFTTDKPLDFLRCLDRKGPSGSAPTGPESRIRKLRHEPALSADVDGGPALLPCVDASRKSSVGATRANCSLSHSSASPIGTLIPLVTGVMTLRMASGEWRIIRCASPRAADNSSPGGTTMLRSPNSNAREAGNGSPVKRNSSARVCDPPAAASAGCLQRSVACPG